MVTFSQILKHSRGKRKKKTKFFLFQGRPQKGVKCLSNVSTMSPRKPNSAKRKYVKVGWFQSRGFFFVRKQVTTNVYVPGIIPTHAKSDFEPKRNSDLLIRCGPIQDLPGVKYTIIRNHKKSVRGLSYLYRKTARSKYGTPRAFLNEEEKQKHKERFHYREFKYN